MKILIIDDNKELANTIREELKSFYAIDVAYCGEEGDYLAQTSSYDLIILDLMLPDISGTDVCQNLRQSGITTPILILTGRDEIENKVAVLDLGADDYIVKPFNFTELKARIRALLRRETHQYKSTVIMIEDMVIDTAKRTVERQNTIISLRRKEFEILEYLIHNRGKVLTREIILEHLWDVSSERISNVIDVHIKHLRDKIDKPFNKKLIKTVPGLGYKLDV